MTTPFQPKPFYLDVVTYNTALIKEITEENAHLHRAALENRTRFSYVETAYQTTYTQYNNYLNSSYAGDNSYWGFYRDGSMAESGFVTKLEKFQAEMNALSNDNVQLQSLIVSNEERLQAINQFLTDLTNNAPALFEPLLVDLEMALNEFDNETVTQSYEVRLCLYTLRTQIELIKNNSEYLDNFQSQNLQAQHNFAALNRLLWTAMSIVGMYEGQEASSKDLARVLAEKLQNMHFAFAIEKFHLLQDTVIELPTVIDMDDIANAFNDYEKGHYQAAWAAFNALELNPADPAMLVAKTMDLGMYNKQQTTLPETTDWKLQTRILNLQTYLIQPTEEHLDAVQDVDATVTDTNAALVRYFDYAEVAAGHPQLEMVSQVMAVFGVLCLMAAAATLIAATCGAAAPLVAALTTSAIGLFATGGAVSIASLSIGFFGRRQGLSRAMTEFAEIKSNTLI